LPILKHEERIGAVLAGRFRVEAILGRGGMGVVFKGEALDSGRPVAIKLLNYEYAERADVVSRFIREANMMRDLAHPNIVEVYDLGQDDDGTVYLVLEFLDGQSLGDRLAELGLLGVVEAADVLLPVMDALAFSHARGVIHRDLKPDNIYITRDSGGKIVPKLLDFGIAKTLDKDSTALTQTGFVLGTPEYMSPEQAQGTGVGAAADIYSMGVVFYECLSGALPTGDLEGAAVLVATATGRTTALGTRAPWLPKNVVDVVQRAIDVDPARRYPDMAAFANAMAHACGIVRKTGDVRPPEGAVSRRKTQMGLRDPKLKASSPSLVEFHQSNAYELGPVATSASPIATPAPAAAKRSASQGALIAVALAVVALGAGGAIAFAQHRKGPNADLSPRPTVTAAEDVVIAQRAEPEPDAASQAINEAADASSSAVVAAGRAGRARPAVGANAPPTQPTQPATPTQPTQTAQQAQPAQTTQPAQSNPQPTTPPSNPSGAGGRTTTSAGQPPSANNPLSEYE
jgi:serine/threonine protein kinase